MATRYPRKGEVWTTPDGTRVEWLIDGAAGVAIQACDVLVNGKTVNIGDMIPRGLFGEGGGPGPGVTITTAEGAQ